MKSAIPALILGALLAGCTTAASGPTATPTSAPRPTAETSATLSYDAEGRIIQRRVVVAGGWKGAYTLTASGDEGVIPFGVGSVLGISGIEANCDITDVLIRNAQGVDAQVTDIWEPGEGPCDFALTLVPSVPPQSSLDPAPYSFDLIAQTPTGDTAIYVAGEVFRPFEVSDLDLPIDLDQIATILQSDSRLHFNYKDTTKLESSCGQGTHLGDIFELYADFPEGSPGVEAPTYNAYAPSDFILAPGIQGDADRKLVFSTFVGYNLTREPVYFSYIHLTGLEDGMQQEFAGALGIPPSALDIDWDNPQKQVGPFGDWADSRPTLGRVESGELVGYKKAPWDWAPDWGHRHALILHVNLTKNDTTDNMSPVEASMPELTDRYMNLIITGLVLERGLTIGIEYEGEDWYNHPEYGLEHIDPVVREQIVLVQQPDRPHHYDVSRK